MSDRHVRLPGVLGGDDDAGAFDAPPMSEGLTVDDLNRLAEKVASVADRLYDVDRGTALDGYTDLVNVAAGLLAAAREVEGLRARLAAVEALLPMDDSVLPITTDDVRQALGQPLGEYLLIRTADIAAAGPVPVTPVTEPEDEEPLRCVHELPFDECDGPDAHTEPSRPGVSL